jgi:hypothetical protein
MRFLPGTAVFRQNVVRRAREYPRSADRCSHDRECLAGADRIQKFRHIDSSLELSLSPMPITTARVRIKGSRTTAPSPEKSSRLHAVGSMPFPRSAGSITATGASPDRDRARPRPLQMADLSRWLPRPSPRGSVSGRSLIPSPPGALSPGPEVYTEHRRGVGQPPMRFLTGTPRVARAARRPPPRARAALSTLRPARPLANAAPDALRSRPSRVAVVAGRAGLPRRRAERTVPGRRRRALRTWFHPPPCTHGQREGVKTTPWRP